MSGFEILIGYAGRYVPNEHSRAEIARSRERYKQTLERERELAPQHRAWKQRMLSRRQERETLSSELDGALVGAALSVANSYRRSG